MSLKLYFAVDAISAIWGGGAWVCLAPLDLKQTLQFFFVFIYILVVILLIKTDIS